MNPFHDRLTVTRFAARKKTGPKLVMLTAYDYPTARLLDEAGVDGVLVGDSVATTIQGHATTLPVTLDQIIYHAEMVCRAVRRALVVVDLPFPTFQLGPQRAIEAAARILKETTAQAVKLESGLDQAEVIRALVGAGIPVMAHCGLRPQNVHQMGGYKVQREEERLLAEARAAAAAGAFAMVLETIPAAIAQRLTSAVSVPTIGIGAGSGCDGQVLVTPDLLGLTGEPTPRFVRRYADLAGVIKHAAQEFVRDVQGGVFPAHEHEYE